MSQDVAVLYVEDDPLSVEIMDFLLKEDMKLAHVTIWEESSNFVARVRALKPRPSVVFLDIHTPPHNGFQMLNMLRQMDEFHGVPVVAMTASVMDDEVKTLKEAGFNGAIGKPIDQLGFPHLFERILNGEEIWRIDS